ncbi:MAG TPA: HAMP domain-containing sensor histidine kinase [Dehalococcoidia bacterium]|nr:HAMP domain-containing sensor histidine kinase [Dehalococcoidia bacterium]
MSLRTRLTVVYTLVVAGVLLVFGLLLYVTLFQALSRDTDQKLAWRTQQVRSTLWPAAGASLTPADLTAARLDLSPLEALDAPGLYVRVFDAQGQLIGTSDNLKNGWLPANPANVSRALAGRTVTADIDAGSGRLLRLRTTPVSLGKREIGVLQVGESLQPLHDTMARMRLILLGLGALALAASAAAVWLVARRGLRPLALIAGTAAEIRDSGDFSRRLALTRRGDEVGMLASAFDAVLGKAEETLLRHRQFVAACSHELRTPLLIVRGNLDLLDRVDDAAERQECLDEARAEAAQMQRLVADLLTLAQVERGQVVEQQPVELAGLLREVYRQLAPRADERQLSLSAPAAVVVSGDRVRLKQVLTNLVENALAYTPTGGSVELGLGVAAGAAQIWVRDTGIGIAAVEHERIFEPFYRVTSTGGGNRPGAGLGLSIVRYLVEAHGGTITLQSRPGEGSTFGVSLPLAAPTALPEPLSRTA